MPASVVYRFILKIVHLSINCILFFTMTLYKIRRCFHLQRGLVTPDQVTQARGLKKKPKHIGFLFTEDNLSLAHVTSLLLWCRLSDIYEVTLYDWAGELKKNKVKIEKAAAAFSINFAGERSGTENRVNHKSNHVEDRTTTEQTSFKYSSNGFTPDGFSISGRNVDMPVHIFSVEEGRESLVRVARVLSEQDKDVDIALIDKYMEDMFGLRECDLIIQFGHTQSTMGFSPWHLRLTEIFNFYSHENFCYQDFYQILHRYSLSNQRRGK